MKRVAAQEKSRISHSGCGSSVHSYTTYNYSKECSVVLLTAASLSFGFECTAEKLLVEEHDALSIGRPTHFARLEFL